jgi:hypothetical protein
MRHETSSEKVRVSSGLARPPIRAGGNPVRVTASHGSGFTPCSQFGNERIEATAAKQARCKGNGGSRP